MRQWERQWERQKTRKRQRQRKIYGWAGEEAVGEAASEEEAGEVVETKGEEEACRDRERGGGR